MKTTFKSFLTESQFPTDKDEIEKILLKLNIKNYTIHPNGVVDVGGDVKINHLKLDKIPVQFGIITGDFQCYVNQLTNLVGCPKKVSGDFNCSYNKLTNLAGCPTSVDGNFDCNNNQLTSLDGCPTSVGGFFCSNNQLTNLNGCPKEVVDSFHCSHNKLTTLVSSPTAVGGDFTCGDNELETLKGCPISVGTYFDCSGNKLKTLEGCPKEVGIDFETDFNCSDNLLDSFEGINDLIHTMNGVFTCTGDTKIKTGGLGLVLIDGISVIDISFVNPLAESIISKYLGRPDDIFECQNELIEAGLEEYTKL